MKRMRRQASGGSAPLPSGFHLACPLLTLVFILSLLHSIFFLPYIFLYLWPWLTHHKVCKQLWVTTIRMAFGIAPMAPTHDGGTETGTTPASSSGRDAPRCRVREPQGRARRLPAPRNPDPALMESRPAFSCSLRSRS